MWRREGKGEDLGCLFPHFLSCRVMQAITRRKSKRTLAGSDLNFRKIPLAALMMACSKRGCSHSGQMWWWPRIDEQQRDEIQGRSARFKEEIWGLPDCGRRVMENSPFLNLVTWRQVFVLGRSSKNSQPQGL